MNYDPLGFGLEQVTEVLVWGGPHFKLTFKNMFSVMATVLPDHICLW